MNCTLEQHQQNRERYWRGGWYVGGRDDDTPAPPELPEPCPMASAQARRAWRQE